jgi:hypothetical protein
MHRCECGNDVADNARFCPKCGHRFTHPLVKLLGWGFGILAILISIGMIAGINKSEAPTRPKSTGPTTQTSAQVTPDPKFNAAEEDQVSLVRARCGKADQDYTQNVKDGAGTQMHVLIYERYNTELLFVRGKKAPKWTFSAGWTANESDNIWAEGINRSMPCLKNAIKDPF